ncbi:hypothetical protein [Methylovulum miyakonense]|uniref:hypothetical protein n=1 Tax=Methylovulum miyakonense TaxID=645578 RepID=UPI00037AD0C6|nr:hypothetical protein [Methylovulum miyakonense]
MSKMSTFTIKKLPLIAAIVSLAALALPAQAHELRGLGNNYFIGVGSHVEPAIAGQPNGIDFFAWRNSVPGDFDTAEYLDKAAGDKVEITALPIKLATENFNAPIIQFFPLLTGLNQIDIEGSPGYTKTFNYPTAGAYGYIVVGEIKKQGHSTKYFVEKFVCGAGSQDTTFSTSFDCVTN